jgi:hypothetical protein
MQDKSPSISGLRRQAALLSTGFEALPRIMSGHRILPESLHIPTKRAFQGDKSLSAWS